MDDSQIKQDLLRETKEEVDNEKGKNMVVEYLEPKD
jgi:hypothetical protein